MIHHITSVAILLGATAAQQSTLSIPFYGYDASSFAASVIGASNGATTLQLACPADNTDCGLFPSETLTYGPSTYHVDMSEGADTAAFVGTQDCSVGGTTTAVCTESAGGSQANDPGMSTTTYAPTDIVVAQVAITAGAQKLSAGAGAVGSSAPATASTTTTGSSAMTTSSETAMSNSGSATSSATTTSSSGGAAGRPAQSPFSGAWAAAAGMFGLVWI